jgi:hypothetical protein
MLLCVVWHKLTDVSEALTASVNMQVELHAAPSPVPLVHRARAGAVSK